MREKTTSKRFEPSECRRKGPSSVLVVEDEETVRRIVRIILEASGYVVTESESGEKAVEVFRSSTERFDLLITDIVLPGLRGTKVAAEIRTYDPRMRVLFMTGLADDEIVRECKDSRIIRKPFTAAELLASVRGAMEGAAS